MSTDKSAAAIREFAEKQFPLSKELKKEVLYNQMQQAKQNECLSDLTALISEDYVEKAKYDEAVHQRDELKEAMKRIMFSSGTLKTVQDIAEAAIKKIEPKAEECSYWKTTGCCLPGCGTDSCEHHPLNR